PSLFGSQAGIGPCGEAFLHERCGVSEVLHEFARFFGGFQFQIEFGALAFAEFSEHVCGPFRIVVIDAHWFLLTGSDNTSLRRFLRAVCMRNPTLVTDNLVISLISL